MKAKRQQEQQRELEEEDDNSVRILAGGGGWGGVARGDRLTERPRCPPGGRDGGGLSHHGQVGLGRGGNHEGHQHHE